MKSTLHTILALAACTLLAVPLWGQGVTTASVAGRILDQTGEPLIGATIMAEHMPSGTTYGNATDFDGFYRLPNMRVGGPYTITTSYTGYGSQQLTDIVLRLGENRKFDFTLEDGTSELVTVEVLAKAGTAGQNAGASTQISSDEIEALPTLNRDITDFVRLTPQSSGAGGGTSFAGTNNRYNAIYIDGAVNNDVFGLSSQGTNGGQTGGSPFSIDIIDQFQVVLSPYDVSLGGFAGGGVNAVTKSGTNEFKGTAYYFTQNENLAGKTPGRLVDRLTERNGEEFEPTKLDEFDQRTFGASLGGPLIQNKLFFFANFELQRDETPAPFEFGQYGGSASQQDITDLRNRLINEFNYDPGTFGNTSDQLEASRFFVKFNYNINNDHNLVLRHNYNNLESFGRNVSGRQRINFSNNGVYFPSITNSTALELNSTFGSNASNNLIIGYTRVKDDRSPLGGNFPNVFISDGDGSIAFGSEAFSTGNFLEQSSFTLTDNFKLYRGEHTITLGTHNEFYSFNNVFIRQNFGSYFFRSLDDFNEGKVSGYDRTYSLIDDSIGDDTEAAAVFDAAQLGIYAQDEWVVNQNLTLTAGVRLDVPVLTDDPQFNPLLGQDSTLSKLTNAYEIAGEAGIGAAPSGQLMFSPRVGFNYAFLNENETTLRGGVGVFTSRVPFVWPGGMYTNNGVVLGSVEERDLDTVEFRSDINNQYVNPNPGVPGGQVDLFTEDFKYPQVLRANLAVDQELPGGIRATVEGIFTKTLNNILVTNVNSDPTEVSRWTGGPDNRAVYSGDRLAPELNGDVYVASNTSKGYSYSLTAMLAKKFGANLDATLAYTYGDAYALSEGTSSQNSSQWRGQVNINGRNNPAFGRSDFALGHRVISTLNYKAQWTGDDRFATTFSIFFDGQTGNAYSYIIGPDRDRNAQNVNNERGSTSRNRSLVYIPGDRSDINLVDITNRDGEVTLSADAQWAQLNTFIEDDKYLSSNRGGYSEKNGAFAPFQGFFDLGIRQNLGFEVAGKLQRLQISFDVFNAANLLNSKWGTRYTVPGDFNNRILYNFEGYEDDGTTPTFTYTGGDEIGQDALNISGFARWRSRVGLRYIFN